MWGLGNFKLLHFLTKRLRQESYNHKPFYGYEKACKMGLNRGL